MEISNIETKNMNVEDVPLSISYDVVVTNASEDIGESFLSQLYYKTQMKRTLLN
jgi:hypothetical protein